MAFNHYLPFDIVLVGYHKRGFLMSWHRRKGLIRVCMLGRLKVYNFFEETKELEILKAISLIMI